MHFIGDCFGIRSERQLVDETQVNLVCRVLPGLSPTDRLVGAAPSRTTAIAV